MLIQQNLNNARDILKRANIKVTLHRLLIFKVLEDTNRAITAYDIEYTLIKMEHRINLATIYSTLKLFQNMGLLQRNKADLDQAVYFLNKSPMSVQYTCQQCGSIQSLDDDEITQYIHTLCIKQHWKLANYQVMIQTIDCTQCQVTQI